METVKDQTEYITEWQKNRIQKKREGSSKSLRTSRSSIRTQIRNKKPIELRSQPRKIKNHR